MLAGRGALNMLHTNMLRIMHSLCLANMQIRTKGIRTDTRKRCMLATMRTTPTIMITITATVTTMGTAMPIKAAAVAGVAVRQPCIWPSRSTWQAC